MNWYTATAHPYPLTLGGLKGEINCDVCVVGGGFTGISAALELSESGYDVVLLEAKTLADGASGRNGGQVLRGLGSPASKALGDLSVEGVNIVLQRVKQHNLNCDLKFGSITAALKPAHMDEFRKEMKFWGDNLELVEKDKIRDYINSPAYIGGLYDPSALHLHPLNYALGLAKVLKARIYDHTPALKLEGTTITTPEGKVNAKFVILGGYMALQGTEQINRKIVAATAHIMVTEPLQEKVMKDIGAFDANFLMNYFRLTPDNRLLFGGTCNYSGHTMPAQATLLKQRMIKVFPSLSHVKHEYLWGGDIDITLNRLPHFGRLGPNVFFARGYSGHGIALSNLAGKLMAEAVKGQAERFDAFTQIPHTPFPGGDILKRPLFALAMAWFRLRDMLS